MKASLSKMKKQVQRGFTLVEIAIVLVIIGLLIGGVLRGQELLNSARANSVAAQQSSIQTAYFGFVDRYKFMPGDLNGTQALLINGMTVPASGTAADSQVTLADSAAAFNNLAQAGFLSCTACSSFVTAGTGGAAATYTAAVTSLSASNTMVNVFGSPLAFINDTTLVGAVAGGNFMGTAGESSKPMVTTGGTLTSNMLAELDRKSDDGNPAGGSIRYTDIQATSSVTTSAAGTAGTGAYAATGNAAKCAAGTAWVTAPPSGACQGTNLF